jgi:undecaprenyl diphosphate synthase
MNKKELRELIKKNATLPEHIAIIMDGNGRWAKQRSLPRFAGHREGINSVREITRICGEIGIKHLTLYTFSKENWARPQTEVSALMKLLLTSIRKEIKNLHENDVKLTTIGAFQDLPKSARKGIEEGIEITKDNTGLNLNLALSYGSRQEIMQAIQHIAKMVDSGSLKVDDINQENFENLLYTNKIPDPDLLIRTGGEFRVSNFLLWQIAYTEIFVTETFWPAFREIELLEAITDFQSRERRFGKVAE